MATQISKSCAANGRLLGQSHALWLACLQNALAVRGYLAAKIAKCEVAA